jgi:hypothetical protein
MEKVCSVGWVDWTVPVRPRATGMRMYGVREPKASHNENQLWLCCPQGDAPGTARPTCRVAYADSYKPVF